MKNKLFILLTGIFLFGCSPSTELLVAWKPADVTPTHFQNIGILAVLKSDEARITAETSIANALKAKGIRATVTWDIFPFANKPDVIKQMELSPEQLKEVVKQKVIEHQMDGLILISLFDAHKEKRYVPGNSVSVGIGINPGMYPAYGYPYYGYYGYAYTTMAEPGYYVDASTYFTEINLYDISTEKLIWTGQMSTAMQNSPELVSYQFGRVLVRGMIRDDVLN